MIWDELENKAIERVTKHQKELEELEELQACLMHDIEQTKKKLLAAELALKSARKWVKLTSRRVTEN